MQILNILVNALAFTGDDKVLCESHDFVSSRRGKHHP